MGAFNQEHVCRKRCAGSIGAIFLTACVYLAVPNPVRVRANFSISTIDPTGRIAAGDKHTCAIALNDTIWCWGDNTHLQLGSSAFSDDFSSSPVKTTALPSSRKAKRIVAGANHTCVLATDETVWCWGDNGNGNLGDGSLTNQGFPVQAVLGGPAKVVSAGGATTCAALSDDSLKCWGKGSSGQVGNNATLLSNGTPVFVSSVPSYFTVAQIEIGSSHSCAISVLGVAWCWGQVTNGRLGTTASSNAVTPTATASLGSTATEVAAGAAHTCALLSGGSVSCFGNNNMGQLGQALATASSSTPTLVTLSANATHVSAGGQFTCALLSTAAVHCFGDNASGQLGSGSTGSARETPGAVTGLTGTVVDVTTGTSHACAVMSTGQVRCWGLNDQGQLGIGMQTNVATATAISTLNVVPTTTAAPITVAPTTIAPTTIAPTTIAPTTAVPTTVAPVRVEPLTTEPVSATTVTTSTTVVQTTTTSISTSTSSTTSTSTTELTSGTVAMAMATKSKAIVLIHPMAMRRGLMVSATKLAASVSMTVPKRSVGTMRISITKGKQYCAFVGTSLKGIRAGKCTVVLILLPKKGKTLIRSNTLTVKK